MANKLGLSNEVKEMKLGKSFGRGDHPSFHTFRYDFMPASLDPTKRATVDIGDGHQVTVTVPHIEGSGTANTVFKGSKKPYQKECVLIIDNATGEITLEKLTYNVQLKDTRGAFRSEGSSSSRVRSSTPIENGFNGKKSPMPHNKLSPQQKSYSSLERSSPIQKCSPLPKSPIFSQPSPNSCSSNSMPSLNNLTSKPTSIILPDPPLHIPNEDANDAPEIGVLSSSSSSDSSSSGESSDSSDNEEAVVAPKHQPQVITNGFSPSPKKKETPATHSSSSNLSMPTASSLPSMPLASSLPSMPKFSQLSEDLQLSESDSDD
ncbi:ell-associated factor Eaf [Trichonephila clavata]|uniref:Ell-associated factor Eaf n=1 Tax=Trichonephila clavata TaxID=2740835 RepID=A0A8X6K9W6_TRICU|nr:ell-associated factor Eaf [Trichonephila clavata]